MVTAEKAGKVLLAFVSAVGLASGVAWIAQWFGLLDLGWRGPGICMMLMLLSAALQFVAYGGAWVMDKWEGQ